MDFKGILWRVLIAVIVVVILFAIIPLIIQIFGIPQGGAVVALIKIIIGGLALLYVFTGHTWFA